MQKPTFQVTGTTTYVTDVFRGYNHNLKTQQGEFYDMKNLTSDYYPVLSPRKKRGFYARPASPQGLIAKEELCYVDGPDLWVGQTRVEMGLSVLPEECPKRLVSMGAYIIILPDKMYINTTSMEHGRIEQENIITGGNIRVGLCTLEGADIAASASAEAPDTPQNLQYWVDTSSEPHVLKRYSKVSDMWISVPTTYLKLTAPGIADGLQQYDAVEIAGFTGDMEALNGNAVLWGVGTDSLIIAGILDNVGTHRDAITVSRRMPNLDFVIESENRLWGCRYGVANNGQQVNEIYACKLGDFRNWSCYMGISTDSYAVSLGSDGPFTGAITYLGYPIFLKENCIHKIYGNMPSNYQVQTTVCRGVEKGSHESLVIVNERLFYKGVNGIFVYDGSLPSEIGEALGVERYQNAVGGAHNGKYYISMQGLDEQWSTFVYDTNKGFWHKEDGLHALEFCSYRDELYCVDAQNNNIITMLGSGGNSEDVVEWMAQSGNLLLSDPEAKYVNRMLLRLSLEAGSEADVYVQYDLNPEWLHICRIWAVTMRSLSVPIQPRRCDHLAIRIVGKGDAKLYGITKYVQRGSNR